jgi:hypothetical protein
MRGEEGRGREEREKVEDDSSERCGGVEKRGRQARIKGLTWRQKVKAVLRG